MYKNLKIGVAVPAYNEEKLIEKTITTIPKFVDYIVVINDASTDSTHEVVKHLARSNKKITIINNKRNGGIGFSLKAGLKKAVELGSDRVAVMAGDAQMDPAILDSMIDSMEERQLDFIKANRFMHLDELKSMPSYRRFGNILVTILTKISTGYYSIFDTQNGYVVYKGEVLENLSWSLVGDRYEFENTILLALSVSNARVGDFAAPAIYGEEKSTINLFTTTPRVLSVLFSGYWKRIYYKYVLYNFHPIALFIFSGNVLILLGGVVGLILGIDKLHSGLSPTSGSVMLAVLPIILGFQLLLTALILDVIEDSKA